MLRFIQNYSFLHSSAISVTLRSLWLNHWLIWRVASSFRLTWLISRFSHKASSEECWCMHLGIQDATSTTQFSGISGNKWTAFWELLKLSRALPDRRWLRLTSDITCNIKKAISFRTVYRHDPRLFMNWYHAMMTVFCKPWNPTKYVKYITFM